MLLCSRPRGPPLGPCAGEDGPPPQIDPIFRANIVGRMGKAGGEGKECSWCEQKGRGKGSLWPLREEGWGSNGDFGG